MTESIYVVNNCRSDKARVISTFYLDCIEFNYSIEIHPYPCSTVIKEEEQIERNKLIIERGLHDYIWKYIEEATEYIIKESTITGSINVPYLNNQIVRQKADQHWNEKLDDINNQYNNLRERIEKFNSLSWYKRIWRKCK